MTLTSRNTESTRPSHHIQSVSNVPHEATTFATIPGNSKMNFSIIDGLDKTIVIYTVAFLTTEGQELSQNVSVQIGR